MPEDEESKQKVAGVILYRDRKVLLQHRDEKPGILSPGAWAIFGGHLEPGEDPEAGARREVQEELGLRLCGPLELVWQADDGKRERFFFAAELTVAVDQLVLAEGQGMALLSLEEIAERHVVPSQRQILEHFFERWS